MAKFRKARRVARRVGSYFKRKSSRKSSSSQSPLNMGIAGGIYGAARPFAANMVPEIGFLGGYSDNVVLGGAGYLAAKKGSGMIKTAGLAVLTCEAFLAGNKAAQGMMGSNNNSFVY